MLKVKLLAAAAGFVMLAGTSMAYANVNTANEVTGPFSDNRSVIDNARTVAIDLQNLFDVTRNQAAAVSTGLNDVSNNTSVFGTRTGSVDISILPTNGTFFSNGLFNGFGSIMPSFSGFQPISGFGSNVITGPNSINENLINNSQSAALSILNNNTINDNVALDITTGGNFTTNNTTVGDVISGDVRADVSMGAGLTSQMSSPILNLGTLGTGTGVQASFGNGTTGPNSINENVLNASTALNVVVDNNSTINTNFAATANTGNNNVSTNTTVGNVRTGNVRIDLNSIQ